LTVPLLTTATPPKVWLEPELVTLRVAPLAMVAVSEPELDQLPSDQLKVLPEAKV